MISFLSPPFQSDYTMGEGAGEAKTIQPTERDRGENIWQKI